MVALYSFLWRVLKEGEPLLKETATNATNTNIMQSCVCFDLQRPRKAVLEFHIPLEWIWSLEHNLTLSLVVQLQKECCQIQSLHTKLLDIFTVNNKLLTHVPGGSGPDNNIFPFLKPCEPSVIAYGRAQEYFRFKDCNLSRRVMPKSDNRPFPLETSFRQRSAIVL